jgi:ribonuclease VapC
MEKLIARLGFEIIGVTAATVQNVVHAYETWGKGIHPASLNFGDCFAYALAKERGCRLLYVGEDFARTDLERA